MKTIEDYQRRFAHHTPGLLGAQASYAVLCPFVDLPDGVHLLFEVRAATLRRQPGEVCFPGGRIEPGETPIECALREAQEELYLPCDQVIPLGRSDFICHPGGFLMQPVLGAVQPAGFAAIRPSPAEVASVFTVPLSFFERQTPSVYHYVLRPEVPPDFPYQEIGVSDGYAFQSGRMEVPVWQYDGHIIWGMTARIVRDLIINHIE